MSWTQHHCQPTVHVPSKVHRIAVNEEHTSEQQVGNNEGSSSTEQVDKISVERNKEYKKLERRGEGGREGTSGNAHTSTCSYQHTHTHTHMYADLLCSVEIRQ